MEKHEALTMLAGFVVVMFLLLFTVFDASDKKNRLDRMEKEAVNRSLGLFVENEDGDLEFQWVRLLFCRNCKDSYRRLDADPQKEE